MTSFFIYHIFLVLEDGPVKTYTTSSYIDCLENAETGTILMGRMHMSGDNVNKYIDKLKKNDKIMNVQYINGVMIAKRA